MRVLSNKREEKKIKKEQIISQQRIELREDRRSEWVRKEKEIMKQHKGSKRDKVTKSKRREENEHKESMKEAEDGRDE